MRPTSGERWDRGSVVVRSLVAVVLATLLGSSALASPDDHRHPCHPTPEQRRAAAEFVEAVTSGIARFQSVAVAIAEGYTTDGTPNRPVMHYDSKEARKDGRILDPTTPESLVFANTYEGPKLLGALFTMAGTGGQRGPRFGGCLTVWHSHRYCKSEAGPVQRPEVDGRCPPGTKLVETGEMIQTWVVPMKGGPYAHRADDRYRCWLNTECL